MTTIQESASVEVFADSYQFYRKNLLPIERVRVLSQLRQGRVIFDTGCCWGGILTAWVVVFLWPTWWLILLAIPAIGTRYYALFIIGHDGLHRRLFARRSVNDLFNDLFILGPIGAITHVNNKNHLYHHHTLGTRQDPDRHKHGCFNKSRFHELVSYLSGVTSLWRSLKNVFFSRQAGAAEAAASDAAVSSGYTARDLAILIGWQLLLLGGLTLAIGWWAFLVLWLVPIYLFTYLCDNFRTFAEHSHPAADRKMDEHRLITYVSNPVERLLVAPMHMNYHAVHHLYPSIPYYHLAAADREVRQLPAAKGLEWRGSYLGYLLCYARKLPLPECREQAVAPPLSQSTPGNYATASTGL